MMMTREDKEILKVILAFVIVIVFWIIGVTAIVTVVNALDDGRAAHPSDWERKRR